MRRWMVAVALVGLWGCMSTWDRHQEHLAEAEHHRDYLKATSEQQWLIENAFVFAPRSEHTPAAEARRYLHLAQLASKSGNQQLAVDSLRQALNADPKQAPAVRRQLDALPLTPPERSRLEREFNWNIAALQPGEDFAQAVPEDSECWSFRVREVRIRHQRTITTPEGKQREVTYDARSWFFDNDRRQWRPDGSWVNDVGTETEWVNGPPAPRYRALVAAGTRFYTDARVPPCQRGGWTGPYDANGTVFVASQLPREVSPR